MKPANVTKSYQLLLVFLLLALNGYSQQSRINGKIFNEKNEPVAGVSIKLQGSDRGVSSDLDGNFSIQVSGIKKVTLLLTAVGYKDKQVNNVFGGGEEVLIMLESAATLLQDVTVKAANSRRQTVNALIAYQ